MCLLQLYKSLINWPLHTNSFLMLLANQNSNVFLSIFISLTTPPCVVDLDYCLFTVSWQNTQKELHANIFLNIYQIHISLSANFSKMMWHTYLLTIDPCSKILFGLIFTELIRSLRPTLLFSSKVYSAKVSTSIKLWICWKDFLTKLMKNTRKTKRRVDSQDGKT